MKKCKYCKSEIDTKAKVCPYCRRSQGNKVLKILLILTVIIVGFVVLLVAYVGDKNDSDDASSSKMHKAKTEASKQLPIEIKTFSHVVSDGYLYFSACLYNPNDEYIKYPRCRITARDENGNILGTDEFGLMGIYPNMEAWNGGQLFSVENEPNIVDIEVIEPDDDDYIDESLVEFPDYKEMTVINTNITDNGYKKKLVGEIQNDNDFDVDSVALTIVFLDKSGNPIAADRTFVDNVKADSMTPFETSLWIDFITDDYKIYADLWT